MSCKKCRPCSLPAPNSILQPTGAFDTILATQFTFIVDDKLLACILRDIAGNSGDVRLSAILRLRLKNCLTLVKLVPGTPFEPQTCEDVARVTSVLQKYCVPYEITTVLLVSVTPGDPQTTSLIQNLLFCRLKVYTLYIDKSSSRVVLEVSDVALAQGILENASDPLTAPICQPCCLIPCVPCKTKKCKH